MRTHPASAILPPTPFTRSYWVVTGQLLAGFYPGDRDPAVASQKVASLLDCGVTHILNLMEAEEGDHASRPFEGYEQEYFRLAAGRGLQASRMRCPIRDVSVPTREQMIGILNALDAALSSGGCVYVHCWGGRGRTGTVIGCWLARHGERSPLQKLRELTAHARQHFIHIPETSEQQAFVNQWRIGQ